MRIIYLFCLIERVILHRVVRTKRDNEKHSTISASQCILHEHEFSLLTLLLYFSFLLVLETLAPNLSWGGRRSWYRTLISVTGYVALGKSFNLHQSQLHCLQNGKNNTYLKESVQGLYDIQEGKLCGT